MGNCCTKPGPLEGDAKYMKRYEPQSVKYLGKWEKQYEFKGKLDVGECTELVRRLQLKGRIKNILWKVS